MQDTGGKIVQSLTVQQYADAPPPLFTGCDRELLDRADLADHEHLTGNGEACPCDPDTESYTVELTDSGRREVRAYRSAPGFSPFPVGCDDVVVGVVDEDVLALLDEADARRDADHEPVELRPLRDRVLVELVEVVKQEGSIFTAATTEGATEYGRIVSVGPEVKNAELIPGTVVMFGKFSGYGLEGDQHMGLRELDLMFIVRGGVVRTKAERQAEASAVVREAAAARMGGGLLDANGRRLSGVAESARIVQASDADVVSVARGSSTQRRKPRGGRGGKR